MSGKTILLWEDQGFGDQIMFARYIPELKKRWPDCKIWYRGNGVLRNLFKGIPALDRFFSIEDELPNENEYDFHCPLLSLPHRFGTTMETIPNDVPYIEDPRWSRYDIGGRWIEDKKKRIGLCWAGSPRHGKDHFRSIVPEEFQALIDSHPECKFYSLQVGPKADEVSRLKNVIDLAPTITDFTDTAQALLQLNLLVSVDTALVHLAGALNVPCFMACPLSPDWRWLLERETSPWYPKLKLFRQAKTGDWTSVLERISKEL